MEATERVGYDAEFEDEEEVPFRSRRFVRSESVSEGIDLIDSRSRKRVKRKDGSNGIGSESRWISCSSCGKKREVPSFASFDGDFECSMNHWDDLHDACDRSEDDRAEGASEEDGSEGESLDGEMEDEGNDEEVAAAKKLQIARKQGMKEVHNLWGESEEEEAEQTESEIDTKISEDENMEVGTTYKLKPHVSSSPTHSIDGSLKRRSGEEGSPALHAETQRILRERANRACVGGGGHEIEIKPLSSVLQKIQRRKVELEQKLAKSAGNAVEEDGKPFSVQKTVDQEEKQDVVVLPFLGDEGGEELEIAPPTQTEPSVPLSISTLPPTLPGLHGGSSGATELQGMSKLAGSSSRELFASGSDSLANQDSLPATWFIHRAMSPHYEEEKREAMTPRKQAALLHHVTTSEALESLQDAVRKAPRDFDESEVEEEDLLSDEQELAMIRETARSESDTEASIEAEGDESDLADFQHPGNTPNDNEEVHTDEEDFLGGTESPTPGKEKLKKRALEKEKNFAEKFDAMGAKAFIDDAAELSEDEQHPPASDEEYDGDDNEEDEEIKKMISNKNYEREGDEEIRAKLHQRWQQQEDTKAVQGIVEGVRQGFRRKPLHGVLQNAEEDDEGNDRAARRRARERAGEVQSSSEEDDSYDPALRALKVGDDDEFSEGDRSDDEAFKLHFQQHIAGEETAKHLDFFPDTDDPFADHLSKPTKEMQAEVSDSEGDAAPKGGIGKNGFKRSGFLPSEPLMENSRSMHRGNSRMAGSISRGYIFRADDSKGGGSLEKDPPKSNKALPVPASRPSATTQETGRFSALFDALNKQKQEKPDGVHAQEAPWKVNAALKKALSRKLQPPNLAR